MDIIADLHLHGKYSRACSKSLDLFNLEKWAKIKGLNLLGTADFTHPLWFKHIKSTLREDGTGFLKTESGFSFVLQTEVSLIYTQDSKGHRVHLIILSPSIDITEQINEELGKRGRLDYDGRPIFNLSCPELVELLKQISNKIEVIPAHVWTPWFSLFGSMSGFNSLKECFLDQTKHIHALETGLSSDPEMNWRLSQLDNLALVSFSDSHSFWPWRIGREATLFNIKPDYDSLLKAIRTRDGLNGTIEVDPAYGKYHYDGHRSCNTCFKPKQALTLNDLCPVCHKQLTIGVLHRVEELADRPEGYRPKNAKAVYHLVPLSEIISAITGKAVSTKTVWSEYNNLIKHFQNELNVLLNVSYDDLVNVTSSKIASLIIKVRENKVNIKPGYDGVYGKIELKSQSNLNNYVQPK